MHSKLSKSNNKKRTLEDLRGIVLNRELPKHIAIIMDGNGRWAQSKRLPRKVGHKRGVKKLKEVIKITNKLGINHLTVFAFSTENWKRPQKEVDFLMKIFEQALDNEVEELDEQGVKIRVLGRRERLPDSIKKKIDQAVDLTKDNQGLNLNIALNYGGRAEIIDATKALVSKVEEGVLDLDDITEEDLSEELYTAEMPDPELLIRPSGEMRISNFLLWQLAYTEFCFTSTPWPDFSEQDLLLAIVNYQERDRRFGGLDT
jgi:undecaprenyl diphosphate synthase